MKKAVFIVAALLCCFVYAQIEEPNIIKELQSSLKQLQSQVTGMQRTMEAQRREIIYLRKLCSDAGIYVLPTAQEGAESQTAGISKSFFGIQPGETLESLRSRLKVAKSEYTFADKDSPARVWSVENNDPNIKTLLVCTFNERIYEIDVEFADTSEKNRQTIEMQLMSDYKPVYQNTFTTTIEDVEIGIELNWNSNIGPDGRLAIAYIHIPISRELYAELGKRKNR